MNDYKSVYTSIIIVIYVYIIIWSHPPSLHPPMGWGWLGGALPATGGEGEDLIIGGIHTYIYIYIHAPHI